MSVVGARGRLSAWGTRAAATVIFLYAWSQVNLMAYVTVFMQMGIFWSVGIIHLSERGDGASIALRFDPEGTSEYSVATVTA